MRKAILFVFTTLLLIACSRVPITERNQLTVIPQGQLRSMAFEQYNQFLAAEQVITGTPEAEMVQRVGSKLAAATEQYLRDNNLSEKIEGFQWEYKLISNEQANAFCMPGGKIAVFTGILPITKDETGLAVVLGHEIAHAVAKHGNERMSQELATQLGGIALDVALSQKPEQTRQIFMAAYGLGTQVGVLLPYSRLHETEADKLGLIFMALAGYNPEEALDFWQRMQQNSSGTAPPEFLSTHPSHETRIETIRNYLPKAKKYYRKSQAASN